MSLGMMMMTTTMDGGDIDSSAATDYPMHDQSLVSYIILYRILVPVLFGLVVILGVPGNAMVIIVILSNPKMRTTMNLLLLNLAFSDMIFLIFCVPFVTYHFWGDGWTMGDVPCKLIQFLLYVTVYVTVYTLTCIAAIRFLTIVCTTATVRLRTKRNMCILVGLLWAVMLILNIPILVVYQVKVFQAPYQMPYLYCGMKDTEAGQGIFITFFLFTYVVPVSVICTFYVLILRYLRRNRSESFRHSNRSARNPGTWREKTSYATKILIVVVTVFVVCWLPLQLHLLLVYFGVQPSSFVYQVYRAFTHCLAYSNSCMNPLIYNCVSEDFRKAFGRLCTSCFHRSQSENSHVGVEMELLTNGCRNETRLTHQKESAAGVLVVHTK